MSFKVFMIIQSQVTLVSIRLLLLFVESTLGPIFETLLQNMFNHALPVLGLKQNNINLMAYFDNFQYHSVPGNLSLWISLNNYPIPKAIPVGLGNLSHDRGTYQVAP